MNVKYTRNTLQYNLLCINNLILILYIQITIIYFSDLIMLVCLIAI